jgi:O-antigen/teichoic acid export membrane protein
MTGAGELGFLISNAVVNVANFGFFVLVGRMFTPGSYGAISALLSITTISNTPLNAIQAAVVDATVTLRTVSEARSIRRVVTTLGGAGIVVSAIVVAVAPLIDRFFSLTSLLPVVMLALWFTPSIVNSALCGSLMGRLRFRRVAEANVAGAVVRIALVAMLGAAHHALGIAGPVFATALGISTTSLWLGVAMRGDDVWHRGTALELHVGHGLWSLVSLSGCAALIGIDVVLARHLFRANLAGGYAASATAGRIALFLPVAIPIIAYPRFVSSKKRGSAGRSELATATAAVVVLGFLAASVMAAAPHLVVTILFGHRYGSAAPLLRILAFEAACLGVVSVLTYFHVAYRSIYGGVPWLGVVTVIVVAAAAHLSPFGLAYLMLTVAAVRTGCVA